MRDADTRLKDDLVAALLAPWGDLPALRAALRAGTTTRAALARQAPPGTPPRLLDLALDRLQSEPLCPDLRLLPGTRALGPAPVHALVFSAFPNVAHELYPLLLDAYVAGVPLQVIGVHRDWLHDGSCRRAILFDDETAGIVEVDLAPPAVPHTAQALALNLREEAADHARIEAALPGIPLANPLAGAARLDAKQETAAGWERAGLPTPCSRYLPRATAPAARRRIAAECCAAWGTLVIKPAGGTEGRGVVIPATETELETALAADTDLLLCAEHGTLRHTSPDGPVRCTVRLHAVWDGARAVVESGYAQVAADPAGIASAGRGGRLLPLTACWPHLCRPDGTPYHPSAADWTALLETARAGAAALAGALGDAMPALVGLDLLLDLSPDNAVQPVLLEANPRPAGMSHARFVTPAGPTEDPGVTLALWPLLV